MCSSRNLWCPMQQLEENPNFLLVEQRSEEPHLSHLGSVLMDSELLSYLCSLPILEKSLSSLMPQTPGLQSGAASTCLVL
jgi:hypothetical protein